MAFEENIEQYKKSSWSKRLILLLGIGVIYPVYFYMEETEKIEVEIEQANNQLNVAKKKHSKALEKKRDLPALKLRITEASAKVAEIKMILPSDFNIDEVLREVASLAKDLSVVVRRFDPSAYENKNLPMSMGSMVPGNPIGQPNPVSQPNPTSEPNPLDHLNSIGNQNSMSTNSVNGRVEKKYEEHPVRLDIEGTFMAITKFYDSLLHLGYLVHLRDVQYKSLDKEQQSANLKVVSNTDSGVKVRSSVNMVVFKSIGLGEL